MTKSQCPRALGPVSLGHWCLGICWSLGLGHWGLSTRWTLRFGHWCFASSRHLRDLDRTQRGEEVQRALLVEQRVGRLDAQEEAVARGAGKLGHVEQRVVRGRQAVERQHPQHRAARRQQDRALERDRDERRPTVVRSPADVQRVVHDRGEPLHEIPPGRARDRADQDDHRDARPPEPDRLGQPFDGVGAVRVHARVPGAVRGLGGLDQRVGVVELGHDPVQRRVVPGRVRAADGVGVLHFAGAPSSRAQGVSLVASVSLTSSRISKIEIIGSTRMNRKNSAANRPIVPRNVDQSHSVGAYISHDDGRKSRCSDTTMIMNRSSHIPMLITTLIPNSIARFVRTALDHRSWGTTTLHANSSHVVHQYGPNSRFLIMNHSYSLPLYHPKNTSLRYPYATSSPVVSISKAIALKWRIVMKSCSP